MKNQFANEKTGINYTLQGDYYLPDLVVPEGAARTVIGIYGERHRRYIKQHRKVFYVDLLTSGKLPSYLADVNEHALARFNLLIGQMVIKEGITEQLKAENQMEWVGRMNNVRTRAMEIVNSEIIHI